MIDERERRGGFVGWWHRYRGSLAWVALVVVAALGFARIEGLHVGPIQIDGTIEQIEQERSARATSVSGVITLFCRTNNDQDETLGKLVAVSLGNGTFGEDIDPSQFSPFDLQVLASIAKVQAATQDNHIQRVFQRELRQLRDTTPCHQLVSRFQEGKPIPPPSR